ncbi:MAG: AbfB domain-containing protein [Austwickia sp.]|nr:MAG: AbfB domain-containing protein [Austwickia sp.]
MYTRLTTHALSNSWRRNLATVMVSASLPLALAASAAATPAGHGAGQRTRDVTALAALDAPTTSVNLAASRTVASLRIGGVPARVVTDKGSPLNVREMPFVGAPYVTSASRGDIIQIYCSTSRFASPLFPRKWYMTNSGYAYSAFLQPLYGDAPECSLPAANVGNVRQPSRFRAIVENRVTELSLSASRPRPLARIETALGQEIYFTTTAGWNGWAQSLESFFYPGYYLRHQDYRVKLQTPFKMNSRDIPLFQLDSSFLVHTVRADLNPSGRGGSRFQSVNYPDRYIRHYRGIVEVSSASDPRDDRRTTPFLNDSTWLPS